MAELKYREKEHVNLKHIAIYQPQKIFITENKCCKNVTHQRKNRKEKRKEGKRKKRREGKRKEKRKRERQKSYEHALSRTYVRYLFATETTNQYIPFQNRVS